MHVNSCHGLMDIQTSLIIATTLSCLIWIYLIVFNGWFWLANQVLGAAASRKKAKWPAVVAVIPARNEAESIGAVTKSHLATKYRGDFSLIVVDDQSNDGTGDIVRGLGQNSKRDVHVVSNKPLSEGWSGKLWAVHNGLQAAKDLAPNASYVLLTDADITHAPDVLEKLVYKAEHDSRVLVSVMAHLDARGFWGSLLMPAFIFFFQKLYPFASTNDKTSRVAGAAGGCMLVNRAALEEIGGVERIRGSLIDDCSLALALKDPKGAKRSVFLGFDEGVVSLRDNRALNTIWNMVARTAFTQLHFSNLALIGAVIGMALTYLIAPLAFFTVPLHQSVLACFLGLGAWLMAMVAYCPTLIRYKKNTFWALLLPFSAMIYMAMTFSSATKHWRGKGGAWKGRTYS
ncbi:MAG: glycosyltransferase [Hyphomicrobiales bacterium]